MDDCCLGSLRASAVGRGLTESNPMHVRAVLRVNAARSAHSHQLKSDGVHGESAQVVTVLRAPRRVFREYKKSFMSDMADKGRRGALCF